jgi:hypothetical protein
VSFSKTVSDLLASHMRLREVNADLLAACEKAAEACRINLVFAAEKHKRPLFEAYESCQAAIEKAKQ